MRQASKGTRGGSQPRAWERVTRVMTPTGAALLLLAPASCGHLLRGSFPPGGRAAAWLLAPDAAARSHMSAAGWEITARVVDPTAPKDGTPFWWWPDATGLSYRLDLPTTHDPETDGAVHPHRMRWLFALVPPRFRAAL